MNFETTPDFLRINSGYGGLLPMLKDDEYVISIFTSIGWGSQNVYYITNYGNIYEYVLSTFKEINKLDKKMCNIMIAQVASFQGNTLNQFDVKTLIQFIECIYSEYSKIMNTIENLTKRCKELELTIQYAPDGDVYDEAKEHFEKNAKWI